MTAKDRLHELRDVSHTFNARSDKSGFQIIRSGADRHGAFEWLCSVSFDEDTMESRYVGLACIPEADRWHAEVFVGFDAVTSAARVLMAAITTEYVESIDGWVDGLWDAAVDAAETLTQADATIVRRVDMPVR